VSPSIKHPLRILKDQSSAGNDGAIMGRADLVEGKFGKALDLAGHDEWVEFYRDPSLDITDRITMELWVKPRKFIHTNYFLSKGNHAYGLIQKDAETIEFFIHGDKRQSATCTVPENWINEWHHLVGIFDGKELLLYLDGEFKSSHQYTGKILNSPFPVTIGRDSENHDSETNGMLSNAIIDEVRIYNEAIDFDQLNEQNSGDAVLFLDFEEIEEKGHFYMTGLEGRTYGLIWADRTPQPEMWQVKKSAQPVEVEGVDLINGKFKITNRYNFTNLNELNIKYSVGEANAPLDQSFEMDLAPHESKMIEIPIKENLLDQNEDLWLNISFFTQRDQPGIPKGQEVAWEQVKIKNKIDQGWRIYPPEGAMTLSAEETDESLNIKGKGFSYSFDKSSGKLHDLEFGERKVLEKGPKFNVWRAPLANDIDPWNNWQHRSQEKIDGLGRSRDNHWRTMGIDSLIYQLDEFEYEMISAGTVKVTVNETALTKNKRGAFTNQYVYTINAVGEIKLNVKTVAKGSMPQWLPRVGLQFEVPQEMQHVAWFGRGPHENYPDRKSGYKIGTYKSTIDEIYVPYLIPQDYGNRCDVSYMELTNADGNGLRIESLGGSFNFSAHHYSTYNLERAMYPFQLRKADKVFLNIDHKVNGLGDTSLSTLTQHRALPGTYEFSLILKPVE
jgi:beta-galactosidase